MVCTSTSCRVAGLKTLQNTRQATLQTTNPGVKVVPKMPGVRCPTCASNGQESWVIPGRQCGYCGTNC
ncbi:hypothetical protein HYFRA_00001873 [Hymenoscyphus fraxineus]|uniref:Uncharacterized protein n=1 Tax=Hymenoscyphus fraxineus TaxID=746836 RepID=A0A9N9KMM1_9HELO|nr:hypothetical protein HYFRA_00001873 [Hymenoscyphus fraxineus]